MIKNNLLYLEEKNKNSAKRKPAAQEDFFACAAGFSLALYFPSTISSNT